MMQRLMRKLWMTQIPKRKTYQKKKADAAGQDAPAKADKKYEFNTEDLQAELAKSMRIFSPVFRENRMRVILSNR